MNKRAMRIYRAMRMWGTSRANARIQTMNIIFRESEVFDK